MSDNINYTHQINPKAIINTQNIDPKETQFIGQLITAILEHKSAEEIHKLISEYYV